jgi:A/G-specific adenine glycosylase
LHSLALRQPKSSDVFNWYKHNRRSLPWRTTRNPYRILVSETMAQQTQISRVADFYSAWLKRFPTFKALAQASRADVLRQWSGLGYNNRAVRLHELAKEITNRHHGKLPRTVDELLALPGIGKYTAHAVACFAFGQTLPVVDVNIRRVLSRTLWKIHSASEMKPEREIWSVAASLLPKNKTSDWNQALMDIGSQFCTARNPKCDGCPLRRDCASAFSPTFASKYRTVKKSEPHHNGTPRRLIRGKILKILHSGPKRFNDLLPALSGNHDAAKKKFLRTALTLMKNDGIIELHGNGGSTRISLPET